MRRPLMVGALVTAVTALFASAALAAGTLGGTGSEQSVGRGHGHGSGMGMSGGSMMGSTSGMGMSGGSMMGSTSGMGMSGGSMMGSTSGMGMSGGSMMGSTSGMGMVWLAGDNVAVSSIAAARVRAATAAKPSGLHPGEVMWFDNGFYVELKDAAGQATTEVIVDLRTGAVSTEPGPAMMWNTSSGMHSPRGGTGPVDSAKARDLATAWLAANQAGTTIGSIDAYPGYFTLDLKRDGKVSGMMSVSSFTGAVWYHTWHGAFIAMEDS